MAPHEQLTRRSFIQRLVYSILVLFFGPAILEQLDVEATERLVDTLSERPDLLVGPGQLFVRDDQLWFRNAEGQERRLMDGGDLVDEPTIVELSPAAVERLGGLGDFMLEGRLS